MSRCLACKSEKRQELQCESRAKKGYDFCGKHMKGTFVYNNMTTKIKNIKEPDILVIDDTTIKTVINEKNNNDEVNILFLNFANENKIGGYPGLEWKNNKVNYIGKRAGAQEENIIEKSTAFLSLTQIKYPFDSEKNCYISPVDIFATDETQFTSRLLNKSFTAYMIVSASLNLSNFNGIHEKSRKKMLLKMKKRIRCQLSAGEQIDGKKIIILGAFGCGMFSPYNWNSYSTDIALIYKELLETEFMNIYEKIIFSVPTFGLKNGTDYNNYINFFNILNKKVNSCPKGMILNPKSGRFVKINGKIGRDLVKKSSEIIKLNNENNIIDIKDTANILNAGKYKNINLHYSSSKLPNIIKITNC